MRVALTILLLLAMYTLASVNNDGVPADLLKAKEIGTYTLMTLVGLFWIGPTLRGMRK